MIALGTTQDHRMGLGGVVFWHVCPSYCQTICVWMYLLMVPAQLCFYGNIALTIPFQLQAQIWLWTPIPAQFSAEGLVSVFFADCILHIHQHNPPLPLLASKTDVVVVVVVVLALVLVLVLVLARALLAPALVEVGVVLMVLVASCGLKVPKMATVLASPTVRVSP